MIKYIKQINKPGLSWFTNYTICNAILFSLMCLVMMVVIVLIALLKNPLMIIVIIIPIAIFFIPFMMSMFCIGYIPAVITAIIVDVYELHDKHRLVILINTLFFSVMTLAINCIVFYDTNNIISSFAFITVGMLSITTVKYNFSKSIA